MKLRRNEFQGKHRKIRLQKNELCASGNKEGQIAGKRGPLCIHVHRMMEGKDREVVEDYRIKGYVSNDAKF